MTEAAPNPTIAPRRRERRVAQTGVRQLPFARVVNRYRPIELLSADQVEAIHRAALKLLRETGIEVMQEPARKILKAAGAEVDPANDRVRLDPDLVESAIAKAPASFEMRARNRAYDVGLGKGEMIFAATGGPAFAHDCDRGKRPGTYADMCDYIKVVHQLN
ncbi:MAG TPA: trimethylamine methyltransferase family protein, partial [Alphaproteobacteria bacterium]|nr:trimethylamine methyltransferase family protein [Alphaproteobacteria bacterium]